jgi:DNA ligase-associated metallophosphoesterase
VFATIDIAGERLTLLPEKAIYWEAKRSLLLADLHLGKSGHFRKNGIAVPQSQADLLSLSKLLKRHQPERVIFLGDLFHSSYNREWEALGELLATYSAEYELVRGNHDILPPADYQRIGLQVTPLCRREGPFWLRHDPWPDGRQPAEGYSLAGHVHPGVRLQGAGRQRLSLPCFHFGKQQALLPAFGHFTGCHLISPEVEDRVFVIAEGEVIGL